MMEPQMNADQRRYNRDDYPHQDLSFLINGCAMSVLNEIGHGYHEKIYENAMAVAFEHKELKFSQQKQFNVNFQDRVVGTFIPDFVVEDKVIIELKTVERITSIEKGQVMNYLRASDLDVGLIFNFKNPKLEWQRVALSR